MGHNTSAVTGLIEREQVDELPLNVDKPAAAVTVDRDQIVPYIDRSNNTLKLL